MEPVSRNVIGHLSQTRVIFRAALMSCSSLVSLRAVYRDCLVSVEHCSVTVTMGFASGEPHTAITASPMLRVSKRRTANVFREPEVEAGTSAPDAARTDAARPYSGENHLIDRNREPHQRRQCRPRSEHQP